MNDKVLSPALCREYGNKFLELGWREDALGFFQKGDVTEGLETLRAYCLDAGDAYLLARLGEQEPDVWRQVAERALALGKLYFARRAFEAAGDAEKIAMVNDLIAEEAPASER